MRIKTYRKKPVEIQAVLWDGSAECLAELRGLTDRVLTRNICWDLDGGDTFLHEKVPDDVLRGNYLGICTLEGTMYAAPGDYIIKGVKGEMYPCKPDIFQLTYEPVNKETK